MAIETVLRLSIAAAGDQSLELHGSLLTNSSRFATTRTLAILSVLSLLVMILERLAFILG